METMIRNRTLERRLVELCVDFKHKEHVEERASIIYGYLAGYLKDNGYTVKFLSNLSEYDFMKKEDEIYFALAKHFGGKK